MQLTERGAGDREGWPHPAAVALTMLAAYVILAVFLIGTGLLMTHVLADSFIGRWDDQVNNWFVARRGSTWDQVSGDATFLANTGGIVVVAAVVTAGLLLRKWGRRAWLMCIGLVIEITVFLTSNYVVARPRPRVSHLGGTPSTFSWPSGHVAATVVLYGGIALLVVGRTNHVVLRVLAWLVALGLTWAVAISRIYNGEHHPTDVFAGLILGIGALLSATYALRVADATDEARHTGARREPTTPIHARATEATGKATRHEAAVR